MVMMILINVTVDRDDLDAVPLFYWDFIMH